MASSLGSLSDEVVHMILEEVNRISPKSLLNTCLVSHQFCRLVNPLIYKESFAMASKINNVEPSSPDQKLYTFQGSMLAHTRQLTVGSLLNWSSFSEFLPNMKKLESIRWTYWGAPFPAAVKQALLQFHPKVKLFIEELSMGHRTDDANVQKADLNLLKSLIDIPNIQTIKVEINYEHPVSMRWLKEVLLSNKNLSKLHLTLPRNVDGKLDWYCDNLSAYDLCVEDDEKLESLTELVYESRSYCWKDRLLIPISFFNWSEIHHLELRGRGMMRYLNYFHTHDVCFQTLVLEFIPAIDFWHYGMKTMGEFVAKLQGIEVLELANPLELMPVSNIALHGSTLTSLSVRAIRGSIDPCSGLLHSMSYSTEDLNNLNNLCPHISHLALDLDIYDYMPYEHLVSLSRFLQLATLRLYLRFGILGSCYKDHSIRPQSIERRPEINTDRLTVQHLFSYISLHKTGRRLQKLEVIMGDFRRNTYIIRARPGEFERPNILFSCEKDGDGNVIVTDNVTDNEDPVWDAYFKPEKTRTMGQVWQDNMEETMALEEEAEMILRDAESLDDKGETTSLFEEL